MIGHIIGVPDQVPNVKNFSYIILDYSQHSVIVPHFMGLVLLLWGKSDLIETIDAFLAICPIRCWPAPS